MRTEKDLQQYIRTKCNDASILCYKFASPANRGMPDLILITMSGVVWFVEVKTPAGTGRLTELQRRCLQKLEAHGVGTSVIDSVVKADELIRLLIEVTEEALQNETTDIV